MGALVKDFQDDIASAESSGLIDPYELAAEYHHRIVNIHPFADGNGRLSRMLLNVILLKFAGHVSCMGSVDSEVKDYLGIAERTGKAFYKEDMEVDQRNLKGHHELARYTLTKSRSSFKRMAEWVKKSKGQVS